MAEDSSPARLEAWESVDLRVGTVRAVRPNAKARVPAWVLEIDLGPLGVRTSSAQLTEAYGVDDLVGQQVVVVEGLPSRRIAGIRSEVLVLGAVPEPDAPHFPTTLLRPHQPVPDGSRIA